MHSVGPQSRKIGFCKCSSCLPPIVLLLERSTWSYWLEYSSTSHWHGLQFLMKFKTQNEEGSFDDVLIWLNGRINNPPLGAWSLWENKPNHRHLHEKLPGFAKQIQKKQSFYISHWRLILMPVEPLVKLLDHSNRELPFSCSEHASYINRTSITTKLA